MADLDLRVTFQQFSPAGYFRHLPPVPELMGEDRFEVGILKAMGNAFGPKQDHPEIKVC